MNAALVSIERLEQLPPLSRATAFLLMKVSFGTLYTNYICIIFFLSFTKNFQRYILILQTIDEVESTF